MLNPLQDEQDLRNDLLGIDPEAQPVAPPTPEVPDVPTAPELPSVLATGNQAPAPQAKAPQDLSANAVSATPPTGQTQAERVSQALYAAGTATKLPASFFTRPSDDRQKDDGRAALREKILAAHAEKEAKSAASLEGADKTSQTSINVRNVWAATPDGAAVKEKMGPMYDLLSANDVASMGGKKIIEQLGKSQGEVAKTDRTGLQIAGKKDIVETQGKNAIDLEGAKQGGREDLLGRKQEGDLALQKFKDEGPKGSYARAELQASKARDQFNMRFQQTQDNEVRQAVTQLPKGTVSAYEAAAKIDRLINNMGGADKVRGLGLGVGAIPNQAVARDVDELRRNYSLLRTQFNHDYFGANFTPTEQAQGKKAIAAADGATTVGEILDSLDILRNLTNNAMRQATAGWSDRVYQTVSENLAKDRGPLMSPTPQIDTRKGGAYQTPPQETPAPAQLAPPQAPSRGPGEHPINTSIPVKEPQPPSATTKVLWRDGTVRVIPTIKVQEAQTKFGARVIP